jgi:hypothetical protein
VNPAAPGSTRRGGAPNFRWMFQSVVMHDFYPELKEIMRQGMEWWAGYGMTTFSSNAYEPANIRVYSELDKEGRMPVRELWTWNWRLEHFYTDPYFLAAINNLTGLGSDYFWFGGGRITEGIGCSIAEIQPSSKLAVSPDLPKGYYESRQRGCAYSPASKNAQLLYDFIKSGNRFVAHHMVGDRDVDNVMAVIEKASKDAGMTDEQIRAKRHTFDHSVMFPRPDQVPLFQKLGIITSGTPFEIFLGSPATFDVYGEKAVNWEVPKKRLVDAKLYNSLELDHAIGSSDLTIMEPLSWLITRKAWDGKVYAPDQKIDRETALKVATIWGGFYVMRENLLGSLEPGKFADYVVLDRDYLTVPEDEIGKLRVMMTVVGGKTIHLVPSLAKELGMEPAGPQVKLGAPASKW